MPRFRTSPHRWVVLALTAVLLAAHVAVPGTASAVEPFARTVDDPRGDVKVYRSCTGGPAPALVELERLKYRITESEAGPTVIVEFRVKDLRPYDTKHNVSYNLNFYDGDRLKVNVKAYRSSEGRPRSYAKDLRNNRVQQGFASFDYSADIVRAVVLVPPGRWRISGYLVSFKNFNTCYKAEDSSARRGPFQV